MRWNRNPWQSGSAQSRGAILPKAWLVLRGPGGKVASVDGAPCFNDANSLLSNWFEPCRVTPKVSMAESSKLVKAVLCCLQVAAMMDMFRGA